MNTKHVLLAVVGIIAALFATVIITNWNKHILFLSSGQEIRADKVWVTFDKVYYEKGYGTLETLPKGEVDRIAGANFSSIDDWKIILANEMRARGGVFNILSN